MKFLKKSLALLLCLLLVASGCMLSVSATDSTDSETIYFEVPSDWQNWNYIYCHIYIYGGEPLGNWQSKKERCTQVEGNLYAYDTTKVGGLEDGVTYCVIMSADTGMDTYSTVLTTECLGDTLYCDDTYYENPIYFNNRARATFWSNQDPSEFGPVLQITSLGNVIGTCPLEPVSHLFLDFLNYNLDYAQIYSGKTDQQIIDDLVEALGLSKDEVADLIEESGVHVNWTGESFLKSIDVKPLNFIEGTNGYIDTDYNEETGDYDLEYYRYTEFSDIEYTLTFTDGTTMDDYNTWFEYDGMNYDIHIKYDQSYENQWTAGNTYYVTASVLGVSDTFPVTIEKSPIKSIEVEPMSFIEGTKGYFDEDYNYDTDEWVEYYCYSDFYDIEYTVTFNDGTTEIHSGPWFYYDGEEYELETQDNQSYNNQWTAGNTYEATATLLGVSDTFSVTIENTPVKSIEAKPLSFIEGTNGFFDTDYNEETGYYDLEYYRYNGFEDIEYTVTFNDGTTQYGKGRWFTYKDVEYSISITENQSYENQWTVGNTYETTITLLGVSDTFPITIETSPVKSFAIKPLTLTEGINGYYDYYSDFDTEEYFEYFYYDNYDKYVYYTVTFADGTTLSGSDTYVEYKGETYYINISDSQSYDNFWTPGNTYTEQATLMGKTCDVSIAIQENPITSIDVIKQPDKTEFDRYEAINPQGAVLRINYNDGTYEDVTLGTYTPISGNNFVYVKRFNDNFRWNASQIDESNKYYVYLLDFKVELSGKNIDKEVESVTINEEDAQLYITLTYEDNSQKTVKALGIEIAGRGQESADLYSVGGIIITDDGLYMGSFYKYISTGKFYITIRKDGENRILSNTLDSCLWWSLQEKFDNIVHALAICAEDLKTFDGKVTAENFDTLMRIACYAEDLFWKEESILGGNEKWVLFNAQHAKLAFYEIFGFMPDLTLSKNYDAANNSIKVPEIIGHGSEPYQVPFEVTSSNGTHTATISWGIRKFTMTLDEELSLVNYQITSNTGILGDANGDNDVNIKDATAIQKHIAMLSMLSANGVSLADVNGDENVNIKDATTIQKHIAGLPIEFPIGEPV